MFANTLRISSLCLAPAAAFAQAPLLDLDPTTGGSRYGLALDAAGDVNADGVPDLITSDAAVGDGEVWVHSGVDGSVLHRWFAPQAGQSYGYAVAGLGDVNADGFDDVAIGDPSHAGQRGRVEVRSGATGSILWELPQGDPFDRVGSALASAGDVTGDGVPDLLVGATGDDVNTNDDRGSASIHSGVDGALVRRYFGSTAVDHMGHALDSAGDVDGDGIPDAIIASLDIEGLGNNANGEAHVYSGATGALIRRFSAGTMFEWFAQSVAGVGDLDGDGLAEVAIGVMHERTNGWRAGSVQVLSPVSGALHFEWFGQTQVARFGSSVDGGRDVDGDGVPDVVVGATGDWLTTVTGATHVFSGATGARLFRFDGDGYADRMGASVALLRDLNGDGLAEIASGADEWAAGQPGDGYVRVFAGGPEGAFQIVTLCPGAQSSSGQSVELEALGSASLSQAHLSLMVTNVPQGEALYLVAGQNGAVLPLGAGALCIDAPRSVLSVRRMPAGGAASLPLALPPAALPGTSWIFQCVFTDAALPYRASVSSAVQARFVP